MDNSSPSNIPPVSLDYNFLPPLPTCLDELQNPDFSHLTDSPSSSSSSTTTTTSPFLNDYCNQTTQLNQTIYQQNQVHQPVPLHQNAPSLQASSSVNPYPNISVENNVIWPLNNEQLGNYGESSSSLVDVAPRPMVQQQDQLQQEQQLQQLQRQIEQLQKLQKQQQSYSGINIPYSGTSFPPPFQLTHRNQSMRTTLQFSPYTQDFSLFPSLVHLGYKFVLQKELKKSDVNSVGRIILPKRESESNLPHLRVKEGIYLNIKELFNTSVWRMRYRFWPNNKSRMYVLENTGEFVRTNELKTGDFIAFYQDINSELYICSRKVDMLLQETPPLPTT